MVADDLLRAACLRFEGGNGGGDIRDVDSLDFGEPSGAAGVRGQGSCINATAGIIGGRLPALAKVFGSSLL